MASFALGLALSNHHFLAFLLLPAAAATLARLVSLRGPRPLGIALAMVGLGLCTYLYLPLRSIAGASLRLGHPDSPARFFWVVSAEAFQKNQGGGVPQPLSERFADVLVQLAQGLHPITVLLALGGLYVILRARASRRIGVVWATILLVYVSARAWLGFVRSNPDALGYLMPAFAALGALACALLGVILALLAGVGQLRPRRSAALLAAAITAASLLQFPRGAAGGSLARFADTDAFDDPLRRELPPRAVLLAHGPQTIFRYWGGESQERLRPDLVLVPIPLLTYPGMIEDLTRREPALRELLRSLRLEGELNLPALQSLAARRPVLIEMDPRVRPALYSTLIPEGLWYRVLSDGATDADEREGAEGQRARWLRLMASIRGSSDAETRNQVLWRRYMDALYFAGFGDRGAARHAAQDALRINPEATELLSLREALGDGEGPIDVAPFTVGGSPNSN